MMRSLFSGVAGLKTHQIKMDVIGNNIANVNTTGFKRGRVNFQDMISQQMSGAAKPTTEVGGVNPKEVGLGVSVASIDTVFTQGNLQSTGISTDVAIQGNGFFIMQNGEKFELLKDRHGLVVGAMEGVRYQEYELTMTPGSKLFLYTDGVPEAINTSEEQYGTDRLIDTLNGYRDEDMKELLLAVKEDIDVFVGEAEQFDDITMIGFRYKGEQD